MTTTSREWRLRARPTGEPKPADFELAAAELADPAPGQVLVRNEWLSVDPYMRGQMDDTDSDIGSFALGEVMTGGAVGTVIASETAAIPVGATVSHLRGWREYAVLNESEAEVVDTTAAPAQTYLGLLGLTGLTAYAGLTEIAPVATGDVVFVSAAAGAVGSAAGQIARKLGASRVIGSAGGPEKCARLVREFGFDAAIDYQRGDALGQLRAAAPEGIEVYFDNVGGDHLDAALVVLNRFGRIALCGAISGYNNAGPPPCVRNLPLAMRKRIILRGMNTTDHLHLLADWRAQAAGWLRDGSLHNAETVYDGIDNAPDAFLAMMNGGNTGKMLVRTAIGDKP
ncbi:putative NADP-dependent oxidoreductase [Nocardia brasiliensis NBRC 14402]|uniref:NADP-dependent oxidoreductase n=1 Tax=Nocardia brasiliensis TaxID=37326 RepID=UPI0003024F49|nr:NADP-dependent oxidoreductase [Nocardia brasiliensis]ASF12192.1 NADP-dependent oxidoreductase [Nocardia brasiliensis]GAJ80860.1 putative NADP-dependent oxidoreductase [Nocardia brasiliensis NBRC 14402]SUB53110.1 NADPH-dependent curcumin reductase [Nocardia brasiliensis]